MLQIRSDSVLFYERSEHARASGLHRFGQANPYSGKMKSHSQRRIMKAVDMLLQRSENRRIWNPVVARHHDFQIGFCTLTIPAHKAVKASFAHENLLQPFLRTARRKWGIEDYIWKAELQARGQLHYHVTWSEFVEFTKIRDSWNSLLRKHRLSDDFARRHGHFNPNSIDIHAVWKINNLKAYLAKYIAKAEADKSALDGKVWDCSKSVKRLPFSVVMTYEKRDFLEDAVGMGVAKEITSEHFKLFKMKHPTAVLSSSELQSYKSVIL